jgi:hypothetical protein
MLTILHGENIVFSREKLLELTNSFKKKGGEAVNKEAKKITVAELEQLLGETNLFDQSKLVVLEGLHSLPRSKRKDDLIEMIKNTSAEIILWEKRNLTKTMLKKFPENKEFEFKLTNQLWKWLDSFGLKPNLQLLKQVIEQNGAEMTFAMLCRQIRLLIQIKDSGTMRGAPFMIFKLKKQATLLNLSDLLNLHNKLLNLDIQIKTSKNLLNLEQSLNLLILSI